MKLKTNFNFINCFNFFFQNIDGWNLKKKNQFKMLVKETNKKQKNKIIRDNLGHVQDQQWIL